jgi:protein involved in polysaccharide export with SLBB domain
MKKLLGWELRPSRFVCLLCFLAVASCATSQANKESNESSSALVSGSACADQHYAAINSDNYHIQPGDELQLSFYLNPEFDQTSVFVRPDGKIALPFIGDVKAEGKTPIDLAMALDEAYSTELRHPGVAVIVKNSPSRVVYVAGQVSKPGAVPLVSHMTLMDAVAASGGFTDEAGVNKVVIARQDGCGNITQRVIDVKPLLKGKATAEDVALLPSDLVVVPRSSVANLNLVVKQYVRDMLPIQPYLSLYPPL